MKYRENVLEPTQSIWMHVFVYILILFHWVSKVNKLTKRWYIESTYKSLIKTPQAIFKNSKSQKSQITKEMQMSK